MSEYIEREAALEAIRSLYPGVPFTKRLMRKWHEENRNFMQCESAIERIPAAGVRPVVLCRDCQNSYEWANVDGDNYRYCCYLRRRWNHDIDRMVDDDDFCKWGKKREE